MKLIHAIVLAAALVAAGCGLRPDRQTADRPQPRVVTPADFVTEPGEAATEQPAPPRASTSASMSSTSSSSSSSSSAAAYAGSLPADGRSYAVDAMVGQVNGRAVYASEIFEGMREQLVARGKELPRVAFEREMKPEIARRLQAIVIEALILGEAERDLTRQEQQGLGVMLQRRREDLVKRFGAGAAAVADVQLRQQQGKTLDQALEEYRQRVLVERYRDQNILPKINVTRRDIERYYQRHYDEFNPPPSRTIHMIRAGDEKADEIDRMLDEGTPFLQIAANDQLNGYKPEDKGLFGEDMPGNDIFGPDELNEPTIALSEGEYTDRITRGGTHYWIYVSDIKQDKPRPLREVQSEIEGLLRQQQYEQLTNEFHRELYETGSYDPLDEMLDRLMEVAMARYAAPPVEAESDRQSSR